MAKDNRKVRYLVSKPQKAGNDLHYWQPSKKLREQGFLTRRLSNDIDVAMQEAEQLNKELDDWRRYGGPKPKEPLSSSSSVSQLIETYKADPIFLEKASATQRIYIQCLDRIEAWAGDQPISSISRANIIDFHQTLYASKPAFANAIGRQLRILLEFAYDYGVLEGNPARRIKMTSRPPRKQVWSIEDQTAFIKRAEKMGYPSMGFAVLLAVSTAQRQGDILSLCWSQFDKEKNEIRLKQRKTDKWVSIPVLPELRTALESTVMKTEHIICSEATDRAYKPDHFRHLFKEIATAAGIKDLQFRDLRRTAIVRLGEAGISTAGITAISGHDIAHCENILETYMPRNSEMAREAIRSYQAYRTRTAQTSD